ncbi:MAG TPA: RelA/SpoT domain-containing protein [Bryobacteraceae bacterium]|jgi:ppGpp synthetase/RelA/SpoT-type nucleotidyltranferase
MITLSYREIEESLAGFREGRQLIVPVLLGGLADRRACADRFLALSRFFCRLKSADSIVEKARRKGIDIDAPKDISDRMTDILGFRVIVTDQRELRAIDAFLRETFEIVQVDDRNATPGEFGDRGIEYSARYRSNGVLYPFELQLRTFLQHYWASRTFHLFHKKPRELALAHQDTLKMFSASLAEAEEQIEHLVAELPTENWGDKRADVGLITKEVHLVVVEPGEQFAAHLTQALTGQAAEDHAAIVEKKMVLYEQFPRAAIVECVCMGFLAFHLNEPLVEVPIDRVSRTQG